MMKSFLKDTLKMPKSFPVCIIRKGLLTWWRTEWWWHTKFFYSSVKNSCSKFKKSQSVTVFFSFFRNPDTYGKAWKWDDRNDKISGPENSSNCIQNIEQSISYVQQILIPSIHILVCNFYVIQVQAKLKPYLHKHYREAKSAETREWTLILKFLNQNHESHNPLGP